MEGKKRPLASNKMLVASVGASGKGETALQEFWSSRHWAWTSL